GVAYRAGAAGVGGPRAGGRGVKPGDSRSYKNAGGGSGTWARRVGSSPDGRTGAGRNLPQPRLGAGPRSAAARSWPSAGVAAAARGNADFARGVVPGRVCWRGSV